MSLYCVVSHKFEYLRIQLTVLPTTDNCFTYENITKLDFLVIITQGSKLKFLKRKNIVWTSILEFLWLQNNNPEYHFTECCSFICHKYRSVFQHWRTIRNLFICSNVHFLATDSCFETFSILVQSRAVKTAARKFVKIEKNLLTSPKNLPSTFSAGNGSTDARPSISVALPRSATNERTKEKDDDDEQRRRRGGW